MFRVYPYRGLGNNPIAAYNDFVLNKTRTATPVSFENDIYRQQIWIWHRETLPLVYQGPDVVPTLNNLLNLSVDGLTSIARQH
jgi:hypothetical protein